MQQKKLGKAIDLEREVRHLSIESIITQIKFKYREKSKREIRERNHS